MRNEMSINVVERTERLKKVLELNFDDEEAANDGYEALREVQVMERRLLESLKSVLVDLRALITKKEEVVAVMDTYDQGSR